MQVISLDPPTEKDEKLIERNTKAMKEFSSVFLLAFCTGDLAYGERAMRAASEILATIGTEAGWPFFVRVCRALEAAGLTEEHQGDE